MKYALGTALAFAALLVAEQALRWRGIRARLALRGLVVQRGWQLTRRGFGRSFAAEGELGGFAANIEFITDPYSDGSISLELICKPRAFLRLEPRRAVKAVLVPGNVRTGDRRFDDEMIFESDAPEWASRILSRELRAELAELRPCVTTTGRGMCFFSESAPSRAWIEALLALAPRVAEVAEVAC